MAESSSANTEIPLPLCAVVVTYHPAPDVLENLRVLASECGRVLVVDNGSAPEVLAAMAAVPGICLMPQGLNLGLAAALNLGVERALDSGFEWAVTFDQDSQPEPGMVRAMWATHLALPRAAMIGPRIHEEGAEPKNYRWVTRHAACPGLFRRIGCERRDLPEVTMMVTSGSMIELAEWRRLGGFDNGLFIDYIDTEYCLRLLRAGCTVAVSGGAVLRHRLGERQNQVVLGRVVRPTHHAPFRHYYMARNRITVWRRHALAVPHWALFDFCFAWYNLARVLAFENQRRAKCRAIIIGTLHGLIGKNGAMPS
jgi:rhamnosyltransferase